MLKSACVEYLSHYTHTLTYNRYYRLHIIASLTHNVQAPTSRSQSCLCLLLATLLRDRRRIPTCKNWRSTFPKTTPTLRTGVGSLQRGPLWLPWQPQATPQTTCVCGWRRRMLCSVGTAYWARAVRYVGTHPQANVLYSLHCLCYCLSRRLSLWGPTWHR